MSLLPHAKPCPPRDDSSPVRWAAVRGRRGASALHPRDQFSRRVARAPVAGTVSLVCDGRTSGTYWRRCATSRTSRCVPVCARRRRTGPGRVRAHLRGEDDRLVRVAPMLELVSDWMEYLIEPLPDRLARDLHAHMRTGRLLGDDSFVHRLERQLRRPLRPQKHGPKRLPGRGEPPRVVQ
jgi:hypothetical protein